MVEKIKKKIKVYCVNCGYYIYAVYDNTDKCVAPGNVVIEYKDSYERPGIQTMYLRNPQVKNRINNCPDYKRSWLWAIWNSFWAIFRRGGGWSG